MEVTDFINFDSFLTILFSPILNGGWSGFFANLLLIPALLIGLNFSDKIKNANMELIDANPTSISNPIIFKIFGLLFFIIVAINFFTSAAGIAGNVDDFETFIIFVKDLLIEIFWAIVGFAVANLYFQPERVNITVDKSSTVAEDLIALLSFGLKVPLALSKMLSQTIILYGVYLLFFALVFYYSEGMLLPMLGAISTLIIGAFAPFLFYLLFLFLFPIFNFYLAILHIPKIGKDK
tara:strand:+ start:549 stop:1256 length:708 start_codon:yes stop_codon:yes gene_type:complete